MLFCYKYFSPYNRKFIGQISLSNIKLLRQLSDYLHGIENRTFCCIDIFFIYWAIENILDNVHTEEITDWSQVTKIEHSGALLIGIHDTFTDGDPKKYLININNHFKNPSSKKVDGWEYESIKMYIM